MWSGSRSPRKARRCGHQPARELPLERIIGVGAPRPVDAARPFRRACGDRLPDGIRPVKPDLVAAVGARVGPADVHGVSQLLAQAPEVLRLDPARLGLPRRRGDVGGREPAGLDQPFRGLDGCQHPGVGDTVQHEVRGPLPGELPAHGFDRKAPPGPARAARRLCRLLAPGGLRVKPEHGVVAEPDQLVALAAALQVHLGLRDPGQGLGERGEQRRVEDQLLFSLDAPAHPLREVVGRQRARCLEELDRGRESAQEGQAAHVAHEHRPAGGHGPRGASQHPAQVLDVGEVLHDRVEDHEVERARLDAREVVRRALGDRAPRAAAAVPRAGLRGSATAAAEKSRPS